jgi:hypothetical protein
MKLSILVIVVLRLFAITWAVRCGAGLISTLGLSRIMPVGVSAAPLQVALQFAVPVFYGLFAVLAWNFAESISRRVVGAVDSELGFSEVRPENLYTLGLLGMGLHYALANLAGTINWLHYLAANRAGQTLLEGEEGLSLYEVSSVMIPFAAGAVIAVLSPKLGRKLARSMTPAPNGSSMPVSKSETSVRDSED